MEEVSIALQTWFKANRHRKDLDELLQSMLLHSARKALGHWIPPEMDDNSLLNTLALWESPPPGFPAKTFWIKALNQPQELPDNALCILRFCSLISNMTADTLRQCQISPPPRLAPALNHKMLDLRGVACPQCAIKARLWAMRNITGEIVEIFVDEGTPRENVPRALLEDGHIIIARRKIGDGGFFQVKIGTKKLSDFQ